VCPKCERDENAASYWARQEGCRAHPQAILWGDHPRGGGRRDPGALDCKSFLSLPSMRKACSSRSHSASVSPDSAASSTRRATCCQTKVLCLGNGSASTYARASASETMSRPSASHIVRNSGCCQSVAITAAPLLVDGHVEIGGLIGPLTGVAVGTRHPRRAAVAGTRTATQIPGAIVVGLADPPAIIATFALNH
jgi:hypothetical protein